MGLLTPLASFDTYDQSKRHPSEGIFISEISDQLHDALESDIITMSFYRHCCTQMKFIPLDTLLLQQEYLDHLNQTTHHDGSILGACFTMNRNVQPSTPTTSIPSSNLYDPCANIISQRTALDTDCNSIPNVQPHHDAITNTHTHSDPENQPTYTTINIRNHVFTLPPTHVFTLPPTTLRQPAEQDNLMAQSDFPLSDDFPEVQKSRDQKVAPIVQRFQTLVASKQRNSHCDTKTTTTTPTTPTPIQLRNCAGDPADCTNSRDRKVDSIDCATTSTTSTTITDASVGRAAPTTQLQPRNCAGDPADCTSISADCPCNNTNNYTNYEEFQYIVYDTQDLYQRSTLRTSEWLLYPQSDFSLIQKSPDQAQYRDMIRCDVNTSCPLIFAPLIEPEPPPTVICDSLQVPQSGGHKYGTVYFSLRLFELMTGIEITSVLSQLDLNEYNGLALL